jgi:hypothetical protein
VNAKSKGATNMSLYQLTVTTTDISQLQQGILFTTTSAADIAAQVAAINANAPAPASETVFSYANQLFTTGLTSSQVMMGVSALMTGATQTVATLTNFVTNPGLIPSFANFAVTQKLDVVQVVGEDIGLAFAGNASFVANFGGQSQANFASTMLALTGINTQFTISQVQFFIGLYQTFGLPGNATPTAAQIQAAAYGVVFGLNVAQNLEGTGGTQATTNTTLVKNALFDLAQSASSPPGSAYVPGAALAAQPIPFPFQGQPNVPTNFNLTVTQDTVALTQSNSVVSGTFGGAGATWTVGDTITAAAGTTGQAFNITGNGPIGNINVTPANFTTNKVSGVATVNVFANTALGALNTESVTGDFSTTSPLAAGSWTGLTQLNVNSGSSLLNGGDLLTALVTTNVLVTDTAVALAAGQSMTVNGSLTTTINETNIGVNAGAILVNGGVGTTTVSVLQTETVVGGDAFVKILDANGASATAAGTITAVTLDGLSHPVTATFVSPVPATGMTVTGTILNTITDNALTTLTINHSDLGGAAVSIIDNLTTPTATTLTLNLLADGVGPTGFGLALGGFPWSSLVLVDAKNEYSTIHLTLGAQNSFLELLDRGLVTLDTPNAGTGALVGTLTGLPSSITDNVNAAVKFDFSGLNGPNNIDVARVDNVAADVYTLGNFGTNIIGASPFSTAQHLLIENGNANNRDTINWGSGAYVIADAPHNLVAQHAYVNTTPDGAGLVTPATVQQWAAISGANASAVVGSGDTLQFKTGVQFTSNLGVFGSIDLGIAASLAANGGQANTAVTFHVATLPGNTFVFDHTTTSQVSVAPTDALVEFVGIVFAGAFTQIGPNGTGIVHLA